jgi:hypothetical protein
MTTDLARFYGGSRVKFIRDGRLNLDNKQGMKYHRQCQLYLLQRNAKRVVLGVYAPMAPQPLLVTVTPDLHWRREWFCDNPGIKAAALQTLVTHHVESDGTHYHHEALAPSDWQGTELREADAGDPEGGAGEHHDSSRRGTPDDSVSG